MSGHVRAVPGTYGCLDAARRASGTGWLNVLGGRPDYGVSISCTAAPEAGGAAGRAQWLVPRCGPGRSPSG